MNTKHTPGPWFIWQERAMQEEGMEHDEIADELLDSHDFDVMGGAPSKPVTRGSIAGCTSVVTIDPCNFGGNDEEAGKAEALANARLIAAAPELLEAMEASIALADANIASFGGKRDPACQKVYDRCVAAIARATGAHQGESK